MEDNDSDSSLDNDETSKTSRGPTIKSKSNKGKIIITYNKRGVPIGEEAKKLTTFEGMVARTMVPITYETWRHVSVEKKEQIWQYVLVSLKKVLKLLYLKKNCQPFIG